MNIIFMALVVGCIVGLFVGSRLVRSPLPPVTVVQVVPDTTEQRGCLPALMIVLIISIVMIALGRI